MIKLSPNQITRYHDHLIQVAAAIATGASLATNEVTAERVGKAAELIVDEIWQKMGYELAAKPVPSADRKSGTYGAAR